MIEKQDICERYLLALFTPTGERGGNCQSAEGCHKSWNLLNFEDHGLCKISRGSRYARFTREWAPEVNVSPKEGCYESGRLWLGRVDSHPFKIAVENGRQAYRVGRDFSRNHLIRRPAMLIRPGMDGSESARNHPASAISVGSSASSPATYSAVKPNMSEFGKGQG
jgi:hypothetical protein